jgi:hypothetical protein
MNTVLRHVTVGAAALVIGLAVTGGLIPAPAVAQTAAPASAAAPLSADTVKTLQEALNKQGIAVKTDGVLSEETRAAIKKYQSEHHLPVTGEPDKATLEKLGVATQQGSAAPAGQGAPAQGATGQGTMGMGSGGMMGQGMMGKGMMGKGMMGQGGTMPPSQGMAPGQGTTPGQSMPSGQGMPKQ